MFSIPVIAGTVVWVCSYTLNPSPDKIDQAGTLMAQAAIPWWVSVTQFLADLGTLGAVGIILLLFFVAKYSG
ncbi:MAG: hypothetical protein R6U93_05985 [Dehalococcoidia bacterium]